MFEHAGSGYAGNGTLCGALGVSSAVINLVLYDPKNFAYLAMIERLFWWYAKMEFPTERFDHLSEFPKQVKAPATTPLCHTSVSQWTLKAGVEVTSKQKYERCAKTAGEVVYTVVQYLNEHFAGRWMPGKWEPSEEIKHCVTCHGPESYYTGYKDGSNNQTGQMECLACHQDHMKPLVERSARRRTK
jgi:Putative redox-active protein (C_GCAxxG_C_C)